MEIKYIEKDTRAGTTYVEIDRDQHTELLGRLIEWLALLNEGIRDPKAELEGFFAGRVELPKMSRGRLNSATSYIAGILNNQLFRPNEKTGRYQTDFTKDNIEWIETFSIKLNAAIGTETITFAEALWQN
jgi:hypothetical protein